MANSSANLVATVREVGAALGLDTSPTAVERWLRPIEPTEGVTQPGMVVFEQCGMRRRKGLGSRLAATMVAVIEGGLRDTVALNRAEDVLPGAARGVLGPACRARPGGAGGGPTRMAAVTTRSAMLNERLVPKRNLEAMLALAERSAPRAWCARNGTLPGLLLDGDDADHGPRLAAALAACSTLPGATTTVRALNLQDTELVYAA